MKEFLSKTQPHLIPCTIGCIIGTFIVNGSLLSFLFALPMTILFATLIWSYLEDKGIVDKIGGNDV